MFHDYNTQLGLWGFVGLNKNTEVNQSADLEGATESQRTALPVATSRWRK